MAALYVCSKCNTPVTLHPPLSARKGPDGAPMTKAHALFLFRDGTGGMCNDCYIEHRNEGTRELIQRLNAAKQ